MGLLSPLVVDEHGVLVAGFRRYHAIKYILGWQEVPVVITQNGKPGLTNLMENLERRQLSFYEEAQALRRLFAGVEFSTIAETLSMSPTWVRRRMRFWELPAECIQATKDGKLNVNQVARLIDSKDPLALMDKMLGGSRAPVSNKPDKTQLNAALTECINREANDAAQALLYALGEISEEQFFDSIQRG